MGCAFKLKAHIVISEFLGVYNSSSEFLMALKPPALSIIVTINGVDNRIVPFV